MRLLQKILFLVLFIILQSCAFSHLNKINLLEKPTSPEIKNINVALVLGGGGAKAFAHLGVLEVLEENNIKIDLIVGTSAGSGIGALYADSKDIKLVKEKIMNLNKWEVLDVSIVNGMRGFVGLFGVVSGDKMQHFFYNHLKAQDFKDLKIPLVVVAADIDTGEAVVLDSGSLPPAIVASSAIPPIFSPLKLYGKNLVDGGAIYPVPVAIAKKYNPKIIISVNICSPVDREKPFNMIDVTYRSFWIGYYELCKMQSEQAHINIHPDTMGYGVFEDGNGEEVYLRGRKAALLMLPAIKKLLG